MRRTSSRARAARWAVATAAVGAVAVPLASCGELPTPSSVRTVRHVAADDADVGAPEVRKLPAGPLPGERPVDLVRGFIAAAADPESRHALSRSFLATGVRWDDAASLVVYDPASVATRVVPSDANHATVQLTASTELVADRDGSYRPSLNTITRRYHVVRSDGQWRLSQVPAGVLVTWRDVARSYRAVRLYALSVGGDMLVPDPVLLATDRPALATAAVRAQLRGTTDWLSPAAGSAIPAGSTLLGSATVVDEQVTADLHLPGLTTSPASRLAVAAQLRTLLGGLPGVKQVRLLVDGTVPAVPAGPGPTNPDATPPDGPAVAAVEGRVIPVGPSHQGSATVVDVPAGAKQITAGTHGALAAVLDDGRLLWRASEKGAMQTVGGTWTSASWVRSLGLLGLTGTGQLSYLPVGAGARSVDDSGLSSVGPIRSVEVSRDGARIAAIAGPVGARRVYLGRLEYAPPFPNGIGTQRATVFRVGGWTPVTPAGVDVRAVDWAASLELAAVVTSGSGTAVWRVALDGPALPTTLSARGLPGPAESVAAAPGQPILVSSGGRLWRYDDTGAGRWLPIGPGTLAAYPS